MTIPTAMMTTAKANPAQSNARTINLNDCLREKLNTSAACGILTKPIYAQGAMATMAIIEEIAPTSGLKRGCKFVNELEGCKTMPIVNKIKPPSKAIQKTNWAKPDKSDPRMLMKAKRTNAIQAITTSPK